VPSTAVLRRYAGTDILRGRARFAEVLPVTFRAFEGRYDYFADAASAALAPDGGALPFFATTLC